MTHKVIVRALAARNGGPGLTAAELAEQFGQPEALVRNALAQLVFGERMVTCDRDGRYKLGDPKRIIEMA